jgi:hypothetical protein
MAADNPPPAKAPDTRRPPDHLWERQAGAIGFLVGLGYGMVRGILIGEQPAFTAVICIYPAFMGAVLFALAAGIVSRLLGRP